MYYISATLFFLLLLIIVPDEITAQNCSTDFCSTSFIPIRFPFQIQGDGQPPSCGYPGFNLSCSSLGVTILKLPNWGDFFVRNIDYLNQQIILYDPGNCLAGRLLKLNLSGSPFSGSNYESYTFFNCSANKISISSSSVVRCLSNGTNTVVATSNETYANSMFNSCELMGNFRVPIAWSLYYRKGTANDLTQDLELSWYAPNCRECEINGGHCSFRNTTNREIGCFYDSKPRRDGINVFRIICFTIALPVALCAVAIGCFLFCANRGGYTAETLNRNTQHSNIAVVPQPPVLSVGLDDSTIESFTKVVVGESRRLTGPNHSVCSICLSEYLPKDILRCIPECKHCFHADCVDEWLRMNSSCPICRNSPSPSPSPAHANSRTNTL